MINNSKIIKYIFLFLSFPILGYAQSIKKLDLVKTYNKGKLKAINRTCKLVIQGQTQFLNISQDTKEGIVWLPIKDFENGTIEIEMRGKDVLQQSFVGLAFHGLDNNTYDAVYCRPFNFLAKDSVRRIHAIQYVSHPIYTWEKLRTEKNAIYEKAISDPPNPNDWFTMKLAIDQTWVKAYINGASIPSLVITKISHPLKGKIGLFTGSGSGGDFKTVKVTYKK